MRPLSAFALLALAGLGGTPACLAAQEPAALELTVVDAGSGEPLAGARVALADGRAVPSASDGTAVFRGLAAGSVRGEVTRIGYAARSFAVPLAPGATLSLSIPLELAPVSLSPLEVEASPYGVRSQSLRGFYERVEGGPGYYITRKQIDSWNPRQVSDLFRMVPGLGLVHTANGDRASLTARNSPTYDIRGGLRECPIQFFLDGTPYDAAGSESLYLDIRPQEIEGIEVYMGTVGLPPQFRRTNRNCGVILIWKRERM